MVPPEGVEPTHHCWYWILSPARLPVPPRRHLLSVSQLRLLPEPLQSPLSSDLQ